MKKFVELTAFLIACVMILCVFGGCSGGEAKDEAANDHTDSVEETVLKAETGDGSETPTESEAQTETATEEAFPDHIQRKNYGAEFFLNILPDVNPVNYYWVEESENDALSEAIFARQEKVFDYLGVEIMGIKTEGFQKYTTSFKTAVKNKDGSVDALMTHVSSGVPGLISESYLRDFNTLDGVQLDADYWNSEFMDSISIADKYFLGFNDFNILYTHVVAFNKDMMEKYSDTLEVSVYDMVRNYTWTLDEMISLANLVYIDTTSDGKTSDDTFGLTGTQWVPWMGFLQASNIQIVELDEQGNYAVSIMNDKNKQKASDLVDKLSALASADCSYLDYYTSAPNTVPITSGRVLLNLASTYKIVDFLDYELNFGVLPYPMYDEEQKDVGYRSLQWGGYLTVPSYVNDPLMVGETLDVLAFFSKDVTVTFYEKLLGKQVADAPDDSQMLDIVWDSVCTDFGMTYADIVSTQLSFILPHVTYAGSGMNLASTVKQYENTANKAISKFIKKIAVSSN